MNRRHVVILILGIVLLSAAIGLPVALRLIAKDVERQYVADQDALSKLAYDHHKTFRSVPLWAKIIGSPDPCFFERVIDVYVFASDTIVEELPYICRLRCLRDLGISGGRITDEDLKALSDLRDLQTLSVESDYVTDDGIMHINRMKNLIAINLAGNQITDLGIRRLDLPALESLNLAGTRVTDDGFRGVPRSTIVVPASSEAGLCLSHAESLKQPASLGNRCS